MLNLIKLEHRQTTPKTLNQSGEQEEATEINGDKKQELQLQEKNQRKLKKNKPSTAKDTRCL